MCDDDSFDGMVAYRLRREVLSRRGFGSLSLGAGLASLLPVGASRPIRRQVRWPHRRPARATDGKAARGVGVRGARGEPLLHLEPILDVGWSRVVRSGNGPAIDTFRAGGKLAIGSAAEHGHLWAGFAAGLVVQAGWLHGSSSLDLPVASGTLISAPAPTSSLAWAVAPSVSALAQGRLARRLLLGMELGIEHSIPPLQWGDASVFNAFRVQVGLQLGVILGDPIAE